MDKFLLFCAAHKLPAPETELQFAAPRKWRFDYAWSPQRIALEKEGGIFSGGRHSRGKGMLADMEKYNYAAMLGWRVIRYTPDQLQRGECLSLLKVVLQKDGTR